MLCQFAVDKLSNEGSASTRVAANSTILSSSSSSSITRPFRPLPQPPSRTHGTGNDNADDRIASAMAELAAAKTMELAAAKACVLRCCCRLQRFDDSAAPRLLDELHADVAQSTAAAAKLSRAEADVAMLEQSAGALRLLCDPCQPL